MPQETLGAEAAIWHNYGPYPCLAELELELELIQTHMAQKPMLRVEVGARALRVLIKKMRLDGKGKCGCARHSCVGVDLWRASQGGMGM